MSIAALFRRQLSVNLSKNLSVITTQCSRYSSDKDADCGTKKQEAKKKKERTPKGRLDDEYDEAPATFVEKEPLEKHPGGVNPVTGEYGGPAGPEPTRYGDWERKGRVSDF